MRILDHFLHTSCHHSAPVQHYCMVFEVLGESLMGFLSPESYLDRGVPIDIVKQITKQILLGLDYMHRSAGLIHTDLKPENVLICVGDVEQVIHDDLARNRQNALRQRRNPFAADHRAKPRGYARSVSPPASLCRRQRVRVAATTLVRHPSLWTTPSTNSQRSA